MKKVQTFILVFSISLISCQTTNISIQKSCDDMLYEFSYITYGDSQFYGQKINIESSFDDKEQLIRLFVFSPDGENTETSIGWLKVDKQQQKVFNITYDELNNKPQKFQNDIVAKYIKKCWI